MDECVNGSNVGHDVGIKICDISNDTWRKNGKKKIATRLKLIV